MGDTVIFLVCQLLGFVLLAGVVGMVLFWMR